MTKHRAKILTTVLSCYRYDNHCNKYFLYNYTNEESGAQKAYKNFDLFIQPINFLPLNWKLG